MVSETAPNCPHPQRRQILRSCTESNSYTDSHSYGNSDTHSNSYSDSNSYFNGCRNGYTDANSNAELRPSDPPRLTH